MEQVPICSAIFDLQPERCIPISEHRTARFWGMLGECQQIACDVSAGSAVGYRSMSKLASTRSCNTIAILIAFMTFMIIGLMLVWGARDCWY